METEQEKQAHKELNKLIGNCDECCPCLKGEKYCDNCHDAIIGFMDKYGAGVLTRDEHLKELEGEVFGLGNALEDYKEENRKLKKECKQWKETCEILADPEIRKSITKSLKQFAEGKGIKLKDL